MVFPIRESEALALSKVYFDEDLAELRKQNPEKGIMVLCPKNENKECFVLVSDPNLPRDPNSNETVGIFFRIDNWRLDYWKGKLLDEVTKKSDLFK